MSQKVKKAVILTAGLGTRFLPITKVVPKALLPVGNKPIIQILVEEAVNSGIEEITIVISPEQKAVKNYFTEDPRLHAELTERGKAELAKDLEKLHQMAEINFEVQEKALGDADAILKAKSHIKDKPFAVLFGDDLIKNDPPALTQLIKVFEEKNAPVICSQKVPKDKIHLYGVIGPEDKTNNVGNEDGYQDKDKTIKVSSLIEKPSQEKAPSNFAIIGKYVCSAETLNYLEKSQASHPDGEIRLIDAFRAMLEDKKDIYAQEVEGERFDAGHPEGLLKANIGFSS